MSQDTQSAQHWPHSQQSTIVDYNAAYLSISSEQSIPIQGNNSTALSQRQPESHQERVLGPFLTGPDEFFGASHTFVQPSTPDPSRLCMAEERNMALGHDDLFSQDLLGLNFQGLFPFPFDGTSPGHDLRPFLISSNGATGQSTTMDFPAQSPVVPSAARPAVVELVAIEDEIRPVGSGQIQQASGRRRKKEGNIVCPFRNTGCNATFTSPHNAIYHRNAHLGLKPYKCTECSYAAAAPATLRKHMMRHQRSSNGERDPRELETC
ncbi:hypothetical protein JOM56_013999 [Amanita muscaria]